MQQTTVRLRSPPSAACKQALPCRERITLDADHSPFFSRVEPLTDVLLNLQD